MNTNTKEFEKSKMSEDLSNQSLAYPVILLLVAEVFLFQSVIPMMLSGKETVTFVISTAICLLCCSVFFLSAKKTSTAIWLVVLLALCALYVGSPILPALIFGYVVYQGAISAMICSGKGLRLIICCIAPLLSCAACAMITGDIFISLLSLLFLLPALVMGITSRANSCKTTSVAACAIINFLLTFSLFALVVYSTFGSISLDSINATIEIFKTDFINNTEAALKQFTQLEVTTFIKKELLALIDSYVNMAVGIVGALAIISAYLSYSMQTGIFRSTGIDRYLTEKATTVTVSTSAAAVFIVAHVLSYTTDASGKTSLVATIGGNLCLVLLPALILMGFKTVRALPQKLGFFGIIILLVLIIMAFGMLSQLPTLIALIGAFCIIVQSIDVWAKDHYGKGENK